MLETPHVIVGAVIAAKVGNPALAIPLAFASHFVLDSTLHWNPHFYTETKNGRKPSAKSMLFVMVDSSIALIIGSLISIKMLPNTALALTVFFACFASVISDVAKIPYFFFNRRHGFFKRWVDMERKIQVETKSFTWGMLTQLVVIGAALWWLGS